MSRSRSSSRSPSERPSEKKSSECDKDTSERRARSPSDPREKRRREEQKDLVACVAHAVEKTNLLKLEDFTEDRLTMRNLENSYMRYGGSFVVELIEEVLHSVGFDVRDRRDIHVPHKFAGIRVNRIMRYMEEERRRAGAPRKVSVTKLMEKLDIEDDKIEEKLRSLTQRQLRKISEGLGEGSDGRERLLERIEASSRRSSDRNRSPGRARSSYENVKGVIERGLDRSRITLYVEDFTDDKDLVDDLVRCYRMRGGKFVGEIIDRAIDSISRDFRSRKEVGHPERLVAARVKRSMRQRDENFSLRERRREPSRSRSLSGVRPGRKVDVEEFARKYGIDYECEARLKRLSQDQLQRVCGGDLVVHRDCRNVSSLIMARIRDEMRGLLRERRRRVIRDLHQTEREDPKRGEDLTRESHARGPRKKIEVDPDEKSNREVSKSREEKPRSRSASSSDVSDVDRTKPRLRRDRADSRGDKIIEEAVDGAVKKQRIVEPEDFLDDSLTMRLLYSVLERSGREFVEDVLYETVHSINQDVKSRRDIRIPQKYVGIRVKRIVQRKEDDMAFRRRFAARENRRRRERSYSRSSSRSRSRSRHHRISVSDMCDKYSLDAECEDRLRELTQEQLARVFGPDLLIRADCRNPSSIVMSRIRDAVRGVTVAIAGVQVRAALRDLIADLQGEIRDLAAEEVMIDPVTLVETGFTYERAALKAALKKRPRIDPLTNAPLKSQKIVPNRALKYAIEVFNNATQPLPSVSTCLICRAPIDSQTLEESGICQPCQDSILENDPEFCESSEDSCKCFICCTPTHESDFCPACEKVVLEVANESEMAPDLGDNEMNDNTLTKRFETPVSLCRSMERTETPSTAAAWSERLR
ncbi:hypothetical protein FOL47_007908 [Perkinsus chesapeaki]|uniref:RING-type E3 ubiquitin transferase n=1 Tax=Perkinsus chesapeaki TaxID=330153 RepID=A0A7J6LI86_PERCH|nr:hypothetical protein FOL47_007908 [Perkinsus chesapeaki]